MARRSSVTIFGVGILILACGGENLDVGSNRSPNQVGGNGGAGGTSGGGAGNPNANLPLPTWPDPAACTVENSDLPMAGVWEALGAERRVRITIAGTMAEGPCGTVVYGEGAVPPPATDPDTRYPPAEYNYPPGDMGFGGGPISWGPMPGVSYTMLDAVVAPPWLNFSISLSELWKSWCPLQTPIDAGFDYGCVPNRAARFGPEGCALLDPEEPIDCYKMVLCGLSSVTSACACNANECGADHNASTGFNLQFSGDSAEGGGTLYRRVE